MTAKEKNYANAHFGGVVGVVRLSPPCNFWGDALEKRRNEPSVQEKNLARNEMKGLR